MRLIRACGCGGQFSGCVAGGRVSSRLPVSCPISHAQRRLPLHNRHACPFQSHFGDHRSPHRPTRNLQRTVLSMNLFRAMRCSLSPGAPKRGVCCSSGICSRLAYHVLLCYPVGWLCPTTRPEKPPPARNCSPGADFRAGFHGGACDCRSSRRQQGLKHTFMARDPDVIAGRSSSGSSFSNRCPNLDAIVCPLGGGGLIAGIAVAVKRSARGCNSRRESTSHRKLHGRMEAEIRCTCPFGRPGCASPPHRRHEFIPLARHACTSVSGMKTDPRSPPFEWSSWSSGVESPPRFRSPR